MSTTKTVTGNLAYLKAQLRKVDCPPSIGLDMSHTAMVLEGLLELQQQLSALSTLITSATSDSGTKIAHNTGKSLENE